MTSVSGVPAHPPASIRPPPIQTHKEAEQRRDQAAEAKDTKAKEAALQHRLSIQA